MIGTGFYQDDIEEIIKEKKEELDREFENYLYKTINLSLILILILLFISIYFSKVLQNKFKKI